MKEPFDGDTRRAWRDVLLDIVTTEPGDPLGWAIATLIVGGAICLVIAFGVLLAILLVALDNRLF